MLLVLSPAKTLDFEKPLPAAAQSLPQTQPVFRKQATTLVKQLQTLEARDLKDLMSISDKLAELNQERYLNFDVNNDPNHAKAALFAFQGDVYQGMDAASLSAKAVAFAQDHVRILSGLYGVLKPLDSMQPYRLEMGTKLQVGKHNSLYAFWGDQVAKQLMKELKAQGDDVLLNLASNEYFKVLKQKALTARVVNVDFKDEKNGKYKVISFFAKKARGAMARYVAQEQINSVEGVKTFTGEGYRFDEEASIDDHLVFLRG